MPEDNSAVIESEGIFRMFPKSGVGIPLGVRSAGQNVVRRGWTSNYEPRDFIQIFWTVSGRGEFIVEGKKYLAQTGDVVIYLQNMSHDLCAVSDVWHNCWWTLDGALAKATLSAFGLESGLYKTESFPQSLFADLLAHVGSHDQGADKNADAISYKLLSMIKSVDDSQREGDKLVDRCIFIVNENLSESQLGIEEIAEKLKVHRSTLTRRFSRSRGMSVIEYINMRRIQQSMSELKQTTLSVAEVARKCGYADPAYFARVFRKHTGHAPSEHR